MATSGGSLPSKSPGYRVGLGAQAPQRIRRPYREDAEYVLLTYPVQAPSGWTVANLFRDIYGGHYWIVRYFKGADQVASEDYFLSPGLGANTAKLLARELVTRLESPQAEQQEFVSGQTERPPAARHHALFECGDCGTYHVKRWEPGEPKLTPWWCARCHQADRDNWEVIE